MERTVVDDRYILSGLLGGGGMGKVYLARDEVLDRDVALKVLREQYAEDGEFVERFEREAKAAASLNYPHIVSVYDRGKTDDGTYYIAMEHVPGGTLKDRILGEGAFRAAEAIRIGVQVAEALGVAHEGGIVHRDVKPHNVLLTTDGDAKVADFGIARAASEASLSNSSHVLGTAKYMSPEQAMGDQIGPESDLYSLGVVLYEMLTGEVPFEADSSVGVAMKHVTEPPQPPREMNPEIPAGLEAVTMKLLRKKPEERYTGAELVADLKRVGEGLPPLFATPAASQAEMEEAETGLLAAPIPAPASPGGARRVSPRSPRRRGGVWLLVAALVALLAVVGLAGAALSGGPGGPVIGSLGQAAEEAQRALGAGNGKVPGVEGLTEEEARNRLDEEGFGVSVKHRQSSREDEGKVLEQSVPEGKEAERGSRIVLAVGSGPRIVETPDLLGLTPEEAQAELDEAGLELGGRKEVPSGEVPAGEVAAQDPAAGKKSEAGNEVELTVSSGPPEQGGADRVEVPDVSGLGGDAATALLEEAGCEVAGTREESSPEPEGTVIGTDPPIGTAVASGAPVILVVSGGPGAPPADADPAPQPASPSSASSTASPQSPSEPDPSSGAQPDAPQPDAPQPSSPEPAPSSPEPAPSSPEPSSPEPSPPDSSPPAATSPSTAPSSAPASASASASSSPERDLEDAAEDTEDTEDAEE